MFIYFIRKIWVGVLCVLLINIPLAIYIFIESGVSGFNWTFDYFIFITIIAFVGVGGLISIFADFASRGHLIISLLIHLGGGALTSIIRTDE
ncbi:hypothetical protein IC620_14645 [Hazenella sp. IB182357]|uniref:Uncharacterized protein n=1 Tax=Polycladospora coralii TaxID=2771432 RepID=A0A926NHD4_9BACL|nr:hypothetical protein [Polycladospora coralii]MBD1373584.1 hypothetical protein [Polycladospora coralii]